MKKDVEINPPTKFDYFISELKEITRATQKFLVEREPENEIFYEFSELAAGSLDNLIVQIDIFAERVPTEGDTLNIALEVMEETNAHEVIAYQRKLAYSEETDAAMGETLSTGLSIGQDVINKISEYIPDGPWKGVVKDVGHLLAIGAKLTSTTGDQIKRIEQKIASIQETLTGTSFPSGQIKGAIPAGEKPLRDEVQEIEDKIEHFFELVTGNPVPRDDDGNIAEVPDRAPFPELTGSVLWMVWELERKLEHVFTQLVGGDFPRNQEGGVISPIPIRHERSIAGEVDRLCKKISTLAKLLGKTLYDTEWDVDPRSAGGTTTIPQGARGPNATPPRSIKDELHDLEDMLNLIIKYLKIIIDILKRPPWFPPPPEDPEDPPIIPTDLKRIFVYEEGVFEGTSATDVKSILVRTGAFDLAGWIDLTEMKDGDTLLFSFFVRLPGPVRREYRSLKFTGIADAKLYKLSDIVGPGWIVGNAVDIEMTLLESSTGYTPPLKVPYQFIVESQ